MDELISSILMDINRISKKEVKLMEVCGTHTHAIGKHGIRSLLNPNIELLSGPGCPVCVTSEEYIDVAIEILNNENIILTTFGDLVRVKGTHESLIDQRGKGKSIKILYTPFEALEIAENNRDKIVLFLAIGFETTVPVIASVIKLARERSLSNIFFFCSLKLMPPVLRFVLDKSLNNIHGLICPGHVAAVMGADYFKFIPDEYGIPSVITGFEPIDIITSIYELILYRENKSSRLFQNLYKGYVKSYGNKLAQASMYDVFEVGDAKWRGIGYIPGSSLVLKDEYSQLDAMKKFSIQSFPKNRETECMCKEILMGRKKPIDCKAFGRECAPDHPLGPCMISSEGSCAAYYRYNR